MARQYFEIRDLMEKSPGTSTFYIVGQGGVGKSYSAKRYVIEEYLLRKRKFIYVRGVTTETNASNLLDVFADVEQDPRIPWAAIDPDKKYYTFHILPKSAHFWLVGEKVDGETVWIQPIGRIVALTMAQRFKGGTYNDAGTILYDEFINEGKPHPKMADNLSKIINTVSRSTNPDVKVICCGNPDYAIELNPLLENLHLDYARLQDNTAYYFDSRDADTGKIIANNICFFKIANFGGEYLNTATANLFGSAEEMMRATGAVKTNAYIHLPDDTIEREFSPLYCLQIETPILASVTYHRCVWVYYGVMWNEPCCVVRNHKTWDAPILFCRYNRTDFRPRKEPQTYRVNIPPLGQFVELKGIIGAVDANQFIISNDDNAATIYAQIRENSRV